MLHTNRPRDSAGSAWFGGVLEAEFEYIRSRRDPAGTGKGVKDTLVGLALSGGGIRSATTNLGILQALSRMGILPLVDYLCTVSGGGYIGSCLSSLLSLERPAAGSPPGAAPGVLGKGGEPLFTTDWKHFPFNPDTPLGAAQVRHLRTHGSFLVTRKGLLKRETMRSVGNLVSGTMYHLVLVLLALMGVALIYLAVLFGHVPSVDAVLRTLTEPVPAYTTAYEARTEGVDRPVRDPASGQAIVGPSPRFVQSTVYTYPTLMDVVAAKAETLQQQVVSAAEANRRVIAETALAGPALALICFLFLRLAGIRHPINVQPKAGESGEDAVASRVLRLAGWGSILLIGGWMARVLAMIDKPGALWLLLPVIAVGSLWLTTWLLHVLLPRLRDWWSRDMRSLWGAYQAMAGYATWFTILLAVFPVAVYALREYTAWAGLTGVASLVVARAVTFRKGPDAKKKPMSAALVRIVLALAIGVGVFLVLVALCASFVPDQVNTNIGDAAWPSLRAGLMAIGVLCLLGIAGDANRLSPHYFYRDRLAEAYLYTDRRQQHSRALAPMRNNIELPLRHLHYKDRVPMAPAAPSAPYHLVSCAINLAASRDLTRKDRKSGYFLLSRFFCGSTHTRYVDTGRYHEGNVKVARAVTISGAAASSGVGAGTFFAQAFATVLFNLRLGYWMENPHHAHTRVLRSLRNLYFWPCWLWREMTMDTHERGALINLSDGGHTGDNVGIYPLLQRQCRLIIACDSEADPSLGFGSFTEALRHAYIDLGIDVDIDLTMLRPDPETGMSRSHCAVGLIRYPKDANHERRIGYLVYLKNSLTGDEPEPVLNYKSTHSTFPHESTVDQFFDDAQFESYRALGHHIAEHALGSWINSGVCRDWKEAQGPAPRATV